MPETKERAGRSMIRIPVGFVAVKGQQRSHSSIRANAVAASSSSIRPAWWNGSRTRRRSTVSCVRRRFSSPNFTTQTCPQTFPPRFLHGRFSFTESAQFSHGCGCFWWPSSGWGGCHGRCGRSGGRSSGWLMVNGPQSSCLPTWRALVQMRPS